MQPFLCLKYTMKFSSKEIAQYYDVTREHYQHFWKLDQCRSLHYGYWDDTTPTFESALLNINSKLAQYAEIKNGMKILDTGCGEGGSMAWISKNYQVDLTGITLSQKQADSGNAYFKNQKINNAKIVVQDYTQTQFADATFDVIWAIESVCHAEDKSVFLTEMYRVLKPGGKIIMADFFESKPLITKEQYYMDQWAYSWAVPHFETIVSFQEKALQCGFKNFTHWNSTQNVAKSVSRLFRMFFIGLPISLIYNLLHPKTTLASKRNVYSPYWQYIAFRKKLWDYELVLIEKE